MKLGLNKIRVRKAQPVLHRTRNTQTNLQTSLSLMTQGHVIFNCISDQFMIGFKYQGNLKHATQTSGELHQK